MQSFGITHKDAIRIVSQTSDYTSRDIHALVEPTIIKTYETENIEVIEGDFIDRLLPNDKVERYEISEIHYKGQGVILPASYEFKVHKVTSIIKPKASHIIYNLIGHNTRVYNQSTDYSDNIVQLSSESLFLALKQTLNGLPNEKLLFDCLDELEAFKDSDEYNRVFKKFISLAASQLTILMPYLPALVELIKPL